MWFLLSLVLSIGQASQDIFFSSTALRRASPLVRAFAISVAALPVLLIALTISGVPDVAPVFWRYVAMHAALMTVAHVLYMRALSLGPLSQTQPILSLTTVLLIVTTPLMTEDRVTSLGWAGVVLVGVGIYATQHPGRDPVTGAVAGFFSPFVEMVRQPGVVSKLLVATIFSVTSNLDRLCLGASSGPFYLAVDGAMVSTLLGATIAIRFVVRHEPAKGPDERPATTLLLSGGAMHATNILLHVWALSFAAVPYVIAVKRLSIVWASLWGYVVRRERAPHWYRLLGTALVVAGVALILLFGKA